MNRITVVKIKVTRAEGNAQEFQLSRKERCTIMTVATKIYVNFMVLLLTVYIYLLEHSLLRICLISKCTLVLQIYVQWSVML